MQKQTSTKNYDLNKHISVTSSAEAVESKPSDSSRFSEKTEREHLTDGEFGLIDKFVSPGDVVVGISA